MTATVYVFVAILDCAEGRGYSAANRGGGESKLHGCLGCYANPASGQVPDLEASVRPRVHAQ